MEIGTIKSFQESHVPNRIRKSYFETIPNKTYARKEGDFGLLIFSANR